MSNILQELESKIEGIQSASTTKANVGVVREIGDGVAKIEGLSAAMLNEMLEFPGGIYGLALNLEETEVGAIILGIARIATVRVPPRRRDGSVFAELRVGFQQLECRCRQPRRRGRVHRPMCDKQCTRARIEKRAGKAR